MQIEPSSHDLKSHHYRQAFEEGLSHKGARTKVLLLLSTMAAFACWFVSMARECCGVDAWLAIETTPQLRDAAGARSVGETMFERLKELRDQLRHSCPQLLDQLGVPA